MGAGFFRRLLESAAVRLGLSSAARTHQGPGRVAWVDGAPRQAVPVGAWRTSRPGDLTLGQIRAANLARQPDYRRLNGERIGDEHSDWTLSDWAMATAGELGEAANQCKKVRRRDFTLEERRERIAEELADTLLYLDLWAHCAGIDLAGAVARKFNRTSRGIGSTVRLELMLCWVEAANQGEDIDRDG